jgi:hypothetical protein
MIVQEFRFISTQDPKNDEQNWSRKYEYEKILRRVQSIRPEVIHNTSCGFAATHSKFKSDLGMVANIVEHSDLIEKYGLEPAYSCWDITEPPPFKADMVLNISTLEHFKVGDRELAWDMLWNAVNPGGTLIYTFDHPEISIEWLEKKTGATCVLVDDPIVHKHGVTKVIYLELTKEF